METLFSTCINAFTSTKDEITLHCSTSMIRHLIRTCKIRMSYQDINILLFDDDAVGSFHYVKFHSQIAAAHSYSIGKTLYVPTGTVFGANVSPQNWEVFAQSR